MKLLVNFKLQSTQSTCTSTLYHLPTGGDVVDALGVRDLGLRAMTVEAVRRGFGDIENAAQHCRISNCAHRAEPGCAVKQAVEHGDITPRRYQGFLQMMDKSAAQSTSS